MGIVYEVEDTRLDRRTALKILAPGVETDELMWQEARITARLEHPGIVPVHDAGVLADGRAYYAMKLIRGERLDDWLRSPRPERAKLQVFLRICEPVAFAHSSGVVHRDLKPGNIMIGSFGEVLVLDWGLAQARDKPGARGGTPGFAAPEPNSGVRADVYSLGRLLSFLTGPHPSPALLAIIQKCTANDVEQRYADAGKVASDVGRYLDGERVSAHPETLTQAAWRLANRHRTILGLVAAYLLMRALLIFFFWRP
jgi:serine/threonine protein kinase